MDSKIASDGRTEFRHRLSDALAAVGVKASATALAREFNPRADGAGVTVHAARKWLKGEAFPTQERLSVLAGWLNVSAQWLRFGEGSMETGTAANDPARLPLREVVLLNEFRLLDERSQEVIRDMVASLRKHHSLRT